MNVGQSVYDECTRIIDDALSSAHPVLGDDPMLEISEILSRYAPCYRAKQIDRIDETCGFSGAVIHRIEAVSGVFALRAWPAKALPGSRIRGLHALLAHVNSLGVEQVPVPIRNEVGDTLVFAGGRVWQLEPWMPGKADFHSKQNETRLIAAVDCLARFHRAASTFVASEEARRWYFAEPSSPSPAVTERLERIRRWTNEGSPRLAHAIARSPRDEFSDLAREYLRLSSRAAEYVSERLTAAAPICFALQPCLRDVWHDHILFSEDRVTGLIDCSACRSDHVAVDLARLLGSLVDDDRHAWTIALDAYTRHRPLTANEINLVRVCDESGVLLSPLTWFDRRFIQNERFDEPERVIRRLERLLVRLRTVAASG